MTAYCQSIKRKPVIVSVQVMFVIMRVVNLGIAEQQENQQKFSKISLKIGQRVDTSTGNLARIGVCVVRLRDLTPMMGAIPHFSAQQIQYQNLFNLRRRKPSIEQAENYLISI